MTRGAGALVLALLASACAGERPAPEREVFEERALELGLDFVHENGMTGEFHFCEMVGPGAAWLDFDGDGDLDVYLVQGGALAGPRPTPEPGDRLFRNESTVAPDGRRSVRFVDVTDESGIRSTGYGMGVAVGDYDNDGKVDLYVTNFGDNRMYRNLGGGRFEDVTDATGTGDPRWSTSAAFVDYDRDGRLDLFVVNYVNYTLDNHRPCFSKSSRRDYCGPASYDPAPDRLFRNRGDGTFEDVTGPVGLLTAYGAGLGVVASDFDGDGRTDWFVANDGMANFLWFQQEDGTFEDGALVAGVAVNMSGEAEASMGVDAADFDRDGDEDLFMTHLDAETNTLYVNDGNGRFEDRTSASGLGGPSVAYTGFGTAFLDYDNDGLPDLVSANGAVKSLEKLVQAGDPYPLGQRNQLFHNVGNGRFEEVGDRAGENFRVAEVSRGAALADFDDDGDPDVLIANNRGPARLLVNRVGQDRHWIGFRLWDDALGRDAVGSRIEILSGGRWLRGRSRVAASYCSSNDPRVLFGLGDETAVEKVRVHWAHGGTEEWSRPASDRYHRLTKGEGRAIEVP